MDNTFYDGHDELYHHAKCGEDRTMRAGCRCENVVFVFCLFVTLHVRSTVRSRGAQFEQAFALPFMADFNAVFSVFQKGLLFQLHYVVLIFVARWRHNFRKIAVKNFEKPTKIPLQQFRAGTVDVHLYENFSVRRYIALTASVKFHIGSPKTARMNKFVRTKSHTGSKFSNLLSSCLQDGLQLCTYIAECLCGVRWRHNRAPNLEPRFWSISYQFEEGQHRQLFIDLDTVFPICQRTGCALQCTK